MPPCSPEAVAAAKTGAQNDEPAAVYKLARYYSTGKCIPGDGPEAVKLYKHAAELGYPPAFYNIGIIEAGGAQNFPAAEESFLRGAALGHRGCEFMLGVMYATTPPVADDVKAFAWLSLNLSRSPPADANTSRMFLDRVRRRLSADDIKRAEAYSIELKSKYGSIAAFKP